MKYVFPILFLGSLLFGQLVRMPILGGTLYIHDIILGLWLLFSVFSKQKHISLVASRFFIPFICFGIAGTVSLLLKMGSVSFVELQFGALYLVRFFFYASVLFLVEDIYLPQLFLRGLFTVGTVFGSMGILQYFLYPDLRNLSYLGWDPHYYRLFSTLLDPNFMGILLVLSFLLGIYIYSLGKHRFCIIFSEVILIVSLFLTFSRSSYLAGIAAFLFIIFGKKKWRMLFFVVLFVGLAYALPRPGGESTALLRQETSIVRVENWVSSITLITEAPIFGHGFNLLRTIQEPDWMMKSYASHATSGVDNSFLFVLATTGIIGFGAFLFLFMQMGSIAKSCIQSQKTAVFGWVYGASLVTIFVHSFFVNSFFYPWMLVWVWVLSGVGEQFLKKKGK